MVKPKLARYAAVKGSRSFENRCFKCVMGPINMENLGNIRYQTLKIVTLNRFTYPNITNNDPRLRHRITYAVDTSEMG